MSAETELCFRKFAAPVLCLQCVLINWIAPARTLCVHLASAPLLLCQTADAKLSRPCQDNRVEREAHSLAGSKNNDESS